MRCVFVLLILSGICLAGSIELVNERFALDEYGFEISQISEFKTVQDVSLGISKNKNKVFSAYDFVYKAGMIALDTGKAAPRATRLLEQKMGLNSIIYNNNMMGITSKVTARLGLPSVLTLKNKIFRYIEANKRIRPGAYGVLALLWERPTPTGLKTASRECIKIALEDYAYALDAGVPEASMTAAAENITSALKLHSRYTGVVDAETMYWTKTSPEGFDRITRLCSSAIDNIEKALSKTNERNNTGKVVIT